MTDCLYKFFIATTRRNCFISRLIRRIISLIANYCLPIYYKVFFSKRFCCDEKSPIIVSLTSYPARIKNTWLAIESILRQSLKPSRVYLWLSKEQFQNELNDVPKELIRQTNRGLVIRFVEGDIRSHKKYYYCFQEFRQRIVFLVDDDVFYPSRIIQDSFNLFLKHQNCVVANFGFYYQWNSDNSYIEIVADTFCKGNDSKAFFGSGGGTMLIPGDMISYINSSTEIMRMCPTADDIYLNGIVRLAKKEVLFSSNKPLLTIREKGASLLSENGNIGSVTSRNAEQLKSFVSYCVDEYGVNPFVLS